MYFRRGLLLFSVLMVVLTIFSCDEDGDNLESYIPNEEGSTWVYSVTDNTIGTFTRTVKVKGERVIGETTCQIMEDTKSNAPEDVMRTFFHDNEINTVSIYGYESVTDGNVNWTHYFTEAWVEYYYPFVVGSSLTIIDEKGMNPTDVPFIYFPDDDIDDDGVDDTIDLTIIAYVQSQEDITVPAGTFEDAFKIYTDGDMTFHLSTWGDISVEMDNYSWNKPHIGRVKNDTTIDYDTEYIPDYESQSELTTYSFPS